MPANPNSCDKDIKGCFPCHTSCHKKRSIFKTGAFLNQYMKTEDAYLSEKFEGRKKYVICFNLSCLFDTRITKQLKKRRPKERPTLQVNPAIQFSLANEENRASRRMKRAVLRDGIFDENSVKKLTSVTIRCDATVYDKPINYRYKRKAINEKYVDEIENLSRQYKFPFRRLKWRQRMERIDDIAKRIIAMCVESSELAVGGLDYLNGNLNLSHDVLNVVHGIKERLELKLKVDLNEIEFPDPCDYLADEVEEDDRDGKDDDDQTKKNLIDNMVGSSIMMEASGRGYERIRRTLKAEKKVELPSVYKINKQLPLQVECIGITIDENCNVYRSSVKKKEEKCKERNDLLFGLTPKVKNEEEALLLLSENAQKDGDDGRMKLVGAKLVAAGTFDTYVNLMIDKLKENSNRTYCDGDDLILLNSFDGAEAIKTKSKVTSIISFSSSISTSSMIQQKHVQAGSSLNILTWQQMIAKEELSTMIPALQSFLLSRKRYVSSSFPLKKHPRSKLWCYDLHDVKMLYLLTQHSQWNRKHHPFLLCSCKRNIGVLNNETHVCNFITDEEYMIAWERSLKRWEAKRKRLLPNDRRYDESHHRDWCDANNDGVTHFGVDPQSFPISSIRFDMFHLSAAITRRVMNYMRNLMLKQSSKLRKEFSKSVLLEFWPEFHVYCWNNKLNFSKFQGRELSLFVSNITRVTKFLSDKLLPTTEIEEFSKGVSLLTPIFKFMSITYITDESYQDSLACFKTNVRSFYACGKHTFLSTGDEPFYFHCLCFYLPRIADITYTRHKLGLGIFTMQGFERRNKESKSMIRKSCSLNRNSPSLLVNNIRRLLQVYWYDIKSY